MEQEEGYTYLSQRLLEKLKTKTMEQEEVVKGLHKELSRLLKSKKFCSLSPRHQKFALTNAIDAINKTIYIYQL